MPVCPSCGSKDWDNQETTELKECHDCGQVFNTPTKDNKTMTNTQSKHTLKGLSSEDIFNIINADDNLDYIQAITTAVNSHEELVEALQEANSQILYLRTKMTEKQARLTKHTTNACYDIINKALKKAGA